MNKILYTSNNCKSKKIQTTFLKILEMKYFVIINLKILPLKLKQIILKIKDDI